MAVAVSVAAGRAIGGATLSGMMGLVAHVTSGAAALRDAAVESFEGGDVGSSTPGSSRRGSRKVDGDGADDNDSDDEV